MAKSKSNTAQATASEGSIERYVDYLELRKAVLVLRAINHKLRQRMLDLIDQNGRMTVSDIYSKLKMEQSVASQHLAILRRAEVVTTTREGKFIFYSVNPDRLREISRLAGELSREQDVEA